ncbi:alpha/beta hydrolase [Parachlamydia sp. AcF125]|uniref:alpha/beta hydrolase family protein n=1 Tax=Parachlamydia sp. AcF125 TaxID=2795736 RepID=UPI001BC8E76F|nr:alpha/beta hydrolase [Parachlamydia sp. AcF125]MBS4168476.1 hypothetical protein [Parachlamydia sp. AcF125]
MKKTETREAVVLSNEENKLFGILHRPLVSPPYPGVLICHGFGGNKLGRHHLYVSLAQLLAKEGIATLRLDFRGCGDSEGNFEEVNFENLLSDAKAGLKFLQKDPLIHPARLGLLGRSLGGALAVLLASHTHAFKTICLWAPLFSAEEWKEKWKLLQTISDPLQKEELMKVNGKKASYAFYEQLFQLRLEPELVNLRQVPLLHIQGKKDLIITNAQAQRYRQHRENSEAESKFVELPNSDHDFSHTEEQRLAIEETLTWFKRTL